MPTTRRSTGASHRTNQPTLSFNSKSARVTKPTAKDAAAASSSSLKKPSSKDTTASASESTPAPPVTVIAPTTPEPESEPQQAEISIPVRSSPLKQPSPRRKKRTSASAVTNRREALAESVTDSQIRKYWQAEEDKRLAPRVHQQSLSLHEKILRHFDLSSQYGPCIGISRLARWRRASGLGLDPPVEVLAVLMREEKSGGGKTGKLAYIDELAGAKEHEDR